MVDKAPDKIARMFDAIAPRYDALNRLISAGQDVRWRKQLMKNLPPGEGGLLCDVACGTGDLLALALESRPDFGSLVGIDISPGMLAVARKRFAGSLPRPLDIREASALSLPLETASVTALTIAFGIRNIEPRAQALAEFHRVLKPGGTLAILEIVSPGQGLSGTLFHLYFRRLMPALASFFSSASAYRYLPASVATMPTAAAFQAEVETAGFTTTNRMGWVMGAVGGFVFSRR